MDNVVKIVTTDVLNPSGSPITHIFNAEKEENPVRGYSPTVIISEEMRSIPLAMLMLKTGAREVIHNPLNLLEKPLVVESSLKQAPLFPLDKFPTSINIQSILKSNGIKKEQTRSICGSHATNATKRRKPRKGSN